MSEAQRLQEAFEFREPESETRQRGKVLRAAFVRDQEVQALLHDDSVESNTPSSNEFQPHSGEYSDDHVIVGGESVAKATSNGVSEAKSNAPKIDEAYLASELSKRRVMEEKLGVLLLSGHKRAMRRGGLVVFLTEMRVWMISWKLCHMIIYAAAFVLSVTA